MSQSALRALYRNNVYRRKQLPSWNQIIESAVNVVMTPSYSKCHVKFPVRLI